MKRTIIGTVGLSALVLIAGCNQQPQTPPPGSDAKNTPTRESASASSPSDSSPPAPGDALAVINGQPVTRMELAAMLTEWQRKRPDISVSSPQVQSELFNQMVNLVLLSQQAEAKGLDKSEQVQASLQWERTKVLAETMLAQHLQDNPVTEEDAKKAYNKRYGGAPQKEYKARHILVKTEKEAKEVIAELATGADFADLAKKHSTGPSAAKGGDLGWFSASDMVPAFAEAVAAMQKGGVSSTPVKTDFGWHVIRLEDVRETPPPVFDSVKDDILTELRQKMINDYVAELRKGAEIKPGVHRLAPKETAESESAPAGEGPSEEPKAPAEEAPGKEAEERPKEAPKETPEQTAEPESKD